MPWHGSRGNRRPHGRQCEHGQGGQQAAGTGGDWHWNHHAGGRHHSSLWAASASGNNWHQQTRESEGGDPQSGRCIAELVVRPPSDPEDVSVESVAGIRLKTLPDRICEQKAVVRPLHCPHLARSLFGPRMGARRRLTFWRRQKILPADTLRRGFPTAAQPPCHSRGISERFFELFESFGIGGLSLAHPGSDSGVPTIHVECMGTGSCGL